MSTPSTTRKHSKTTSVADAMPQVIETFRRMEQTAIAFAATIRPHFDEADDEAVCTVHPTSILQKDWDATIAESRSQGKFTLVYSMCRSCVTEKEASDNRRRWAKWGIPNKVIEATFDNFDSTRHKTLLPALNGCRDFAARAKDKGGFLMLLGEMGLGKGHLAVATMKTIGRGLFVTHADLLTELRTSYHTKNTEQIIEKYRTTPCFVLDELGVSGGGKDEAPLLYQIFADRHDNELASIITSNEELPRVKEILGERIVDRIREDFTLLFLEGKSFRGSKKRAE